MDEAGAPRKRGRQPIAQADSPEETVFQEDDDRRAAVAPSRRNGFAITVCVALAVLLFVGVGTSRGSVAAGAAQARFRIARPPRPTTAQQPNSPPSEGGLDGEDEPTAGPAPASAEDAADPRETDAEDFGSPGDEDGEHKDHKEPRDAKDEDADGRPGSRDRLEGEERPKGPSDDAEDRDGPEGNDPKEPGVALGEDRVDKRMEDTEAQEEKRDDDAQPHKDEEERTDSEGRDPEVRGQDSKQVKDGPPEETHGQEDIARDVSAPASGGHADAEGAGSAAEDARSRGGQSLSDAKKRIDSSAEDGDSGKASRGFAPPSPEAAPRDRDEAENEDTATSTNRAFAKSSSTVALSSTPKVVGKPVAALVKSNSTAAGKPKPTEDEEPSSAGPKPYSSKEAVESSSMTMREATGGSTKKPQAAADLADSSAGEESTSVASTAPSSKAATDSSSTQMEKDTGVDAIPDLSSPLAGPGRDEETPEGRASIAGEPADRGSGPAGASIGDGDVTDATGDGSASATLVKAKAGAEQAEDDDVGAIDARGASTSKLGAAHRDEGAGKSSSKAPEKTSSRVGEDSSSLADESTKVEKSADESGSVAAKASSSSRASKPSSTGRPTASEDNEADGTAPKEVGSPLLASLAAPPGRGQQDVDAAASAEKTVGELAENDQAPHSKGTKDEAAAVLAEASGVPAEGLGDPLLPLDGAPRQGDVGPAETGVEPPAANSTGAKRREHL